MHLCLNNIDLKNNFLYNSSDHKRTQDVITFDSRKETLFRDQSFITFRGREGVGFRGGVKFSKSFNSGGICEQKKWEKVHFSLAVCKSGVTKFGFVCFTNHIKIASKYMYMICCLQHVVPKRDVFQLFLVVCGF